MVLQECDGGGWARQGGEDVKLTDLGETEEARGQASVWAAASVKGEDFASGMCNPLMEWGKGDRCDNLESHLGSDDTESVEDHMEIGGEGQCRCLARGTGQARGHYGCLRLALPASSRTSTAELSRSSRTCS